jgi:hypothetical protein
MNELQVEQIERLAERLALDGVIELCQDWRALKAENERLMEAGKVLAENIWAEGYVYCMACGQEKDSGHAPDCPALVFSEAGESPE